MPDICCLDVARRTSHVASSDSCRSAGQGRCTCSPCHRGESASGILILCRWRQFGGSAQRSTPTRRPGEARPSAQHRRAFLQRKMWGHVRCKDVGETPLRRHGGIGCPSSARERRTPSRPGPVRNDDEWPADHPMRSPNLSKTPRANVTGVFLVKQFASTGCEYPRGTTRATRVGGLQGAVAEAAR